MAMQVKIDHLKFWFLTPFWVLLLTHHASAQHDSLLLKNGNTIVGEIKSMDKGVLIIETDYSKNDFSIEWSGIKEIYTTSTFLITLTDGRRFDGSLQSAAGGGKIIISDASVGKTEVIPDDIVFLKGVKSKFWSRFSGNIDVGLSFTKANNLTQFNINSYL